MAKIKLPKDVYDDILEYIALDTAKQSAAIAYSHGDESSLVATRGLGDFFKRNNFDVCVDFAQYINNKLSGIHKRINKKSADLEAKNKIAEVVDGDLLGVQRVIAFQNMFEIEVN